MEKFSVDEKNIVLETICEYLETTNIETQYFDSYFEFLEFFQNIEEFNHHFFTIGAYLIYGWMPTIPNITITQGAIDTLNKVKQEELLTDNDYSCLVKSINNSIVGASKILHFVDPKQYPIFDSHIQNFFKIKKFKKTHLWKIFGRKYNDKKKKIDQYLSYKNFVKKL